jgi:hypothetical protein
MCRTGSPEANEQNHLNRAIHGGPPVGRAQIRRFLWLYFIRELGRATLTQGIEQREA